MKGTGSTVAVELLPPDGADAAYARSVENIKTRKAVPKPVGKSTSQLEQETKDYYVRHSSIRRASRSSLLILYANFTGKLPNQCTSRLGPVERRLGKPNTRRRRVK